MSPPTTGTAALLGTLALAVMIAAVGLSSVGLLRARDAFGRLHHGGPAALIGPFALTAAFAIALGHDSPTTVRGLIVALLLATTGPIVAHATARAARLRARGTLEVEPEDAGPPR